ncbi:MAG: SDR family NAD(P)-dependent oxidoreductase [Pseudobutyrivibrio sp.]|nr:SDR family NAD(P)-dependent oxidoreductase [Pseudobutyrivibrio sp.]
MEKAAIVTGASRGIGKEIARALAKEGYNLALFCRKNKDMLDAFADELQNDYGITVLTYAGLISDHDFVEFSIKDAIQKFGRVDVLVNNAGRASIGLLTDMTYEMWDEMIATNLSSMFYTCKSVVPQMVAQKSGRIINISSMWGTVGASCEVAYSAAKGGVNSFTKALGKELSPSNIAVNAIACGVVDTDMNSMLTADEKAQLSAEIPAGRFCSPAEIAQTLVQLLKAPSYMTGQVIGVDGGYI